MLEVSNSILTFPGRLVLSVRELFFVFEGSEREEHNVRHVIVYGLNIADDHSLTIFFLSKAAAAGRTHV